ncbi:HD domain-containing protein [Ruminococcus sp.]|uniref:HD domain-containing protein n=1 Tax=Ruminococcus sp. TaxID=41978 RepID=UPI002C9915C5|nr:HD domain-containing protein [Ruminococcus sp.]HNZ99286.1 HD domain-containing protein [Ruminococcus sp.]HOH87806.1 HD domain-containing protein [Ruminococcus sp.]
MTNERLKKQLDFFLELDKMKNLYRQTYVLHEDRKENDAEHSWHIAITAFLLSEYAKNDIDINKVVKMLLIHDVVEIDAGDTYCYDAAGNTTKAEREEKAAQRIFGLLPDDQKAEYYSLWREFEDSKTNEARFAAVMDRIQPLMLNYTKGGISWQEHGIRKDQVMNRNSDYFSESDELAALIKSVLDDAQNKGWLK